MAQRCRSGTIWNKLTSSVGVWSGLVFLCALAVYARTLAPSITWAHAGVDSGDFASAVACGGVPHPTGYPTYLLLAALFSRLPWGDYAFRLNLLSACAAAAAAAMLVRLVYDVVRSDVREAPTTATRATALAVSAVSGGLLLAFDATLWSQAVIAEIYALQLGFVLAIVLLGLWAYRRNDYVAVALTFLLCGIGLGTHLSLVFVVPVLFWMLHRLLLADPARFVVAALLPLAAGLSVYIVIPLRAVAVPPINWGGAATWHGFWWLISAQLYRGFLFSLPLADLPARLAAWLGILLAGLNGWGIPVSLFGWTHLLKRDPTLATGTLAVFVLYSAYAVFYDTTDSYIYLLPAIAMLILWMAYGLYRALVAIEPYLRDSVWKRGALCGIAVLLSVIAAPWNWSGQNLSDNTEALDYGLQAVEAVEPDSLIIAEGDAHTFALWYVRYGLDRRQDIAVVNDALLAFDWYHIILQKHHPGIVGETDAGSGLLSLLAHNAGRRQIYFSTEPAYLPADYRTEPSGLLWRLSAIPRPPEIDSLLPGEASAPAR